MLTLVLELLVPEFNIWEMKKTGSTLKFVALLSETAGPSTAPAIPFGNGGAPVGMTISTSARDDNL